MFTANAPTAHDILEQLRKLYLERAVARLDGHDSNRLRMPIGKCRPVNIGSCRSLGGWSAVRA